MFFYLVLMDGLIQKDKKDVLSDYLNKIFVFTMMWSIGALLELDDRKKMQTFISGIEIRRKMHVFKP